MNPIDTFERLLTAKLTPLVEAAGTTDPSDVTAIARLRRHADAPTVAAAIELATARARASDKFPRAADLVADREGVEQATSHAVAEYKAARFAGLDRENRVVLDLCCGIGGDTMALARRARTIGVDLLPLRAWMAAKNAHCDAIVADVSREFVDPGRVGAFHIDPARRIEAAGTGVRTRTHKLADAQPGPAAIERALDSYRSGAVKLGPGVDPDEIPRREEAELEWIGDGKTLVQCVAWFGALADQPPIAADFTTATPPEPTPIPYPRFLDTTPDTTPRTPGQVRATVLQPSTPQQPGLILTHVGTAFAAVWPSAEGQCEEALWVPHPALERTGLAPEVGTSLELRELHTGLGIATGPAHCDSPATTWFDRYRVIETLPWRTAKLKAALTRHDAGIVTVKTRGRVVDANRAAKELRGKGSEALTVFALRLGEKRVAVITAPREEEG